MFESILRDIRYSIRSLRRTPGFAAVSISTLAIGIGATTAMFSLVEGVLLRPLPYPDSDRLVTVWERDEQGSERLASYLNFADWRSRSSTFEALAAYTPSTTATALTASGGVRTAVSSVSADFFEVAGIEPAVGRLPVPAEHDPSGPPVAIVGYGFWRSTLGADEDLAGHTLDIQGTLYEVVGVMPPDFRLPDSCDIWVSLDRAVPWSVRGNHVIRVVGRLRPRTSVESALRELDAVQSAIQVENPEVDSVGVVMRRLLDQVVAGDRRGLGLLMAASIVLLLVACINVASALLARGTGRVRELNIRSSLGASRTLLVRQLFTESLTLALLGAAGGVATAYGILGLTRALDPSAVPRLQGVTVNPAVLGFTLVAAVITALLFGLLPALALTRGNLADASRSGRHGFGRRENRFWRAIMAAEVAMALVLLVGGGLLVRSLGSILQRKGGFQSEQVMTARLNLPVSKYQGWEDMVSTLDRVLEGARRAPALSQVGIALGLPVPGMVSAFSGVVIPGGGRTEARMQYRIADAAYFRAMQIPLLRGRLFDERDGPGAPHVAVINESMADVLWAGENPIGRTFNPAGMDPWPENDLTVIGVVTETLRWDERPGESPAYYVHYRQRPAFMAFYGASLVARADNVALVPNLLRSSVRNVDRDITVQVSTLTSQIGDSARDHRLSAFILGGFAVAALFLAAIGVYGVVAYSVARRSREIGIRVALGALPGRVRREMQHDILMTVGFGMLVGTGSAFLLARGLRSLLFEISPADPATFVACVLLIGSAAWLASWVPARRGTRLDPADILRRGQGGTRG